ncbi:MAG: hypothetical protein J6I69_02210 [Bacilli bacterium]|nr:hypothetical protein [Bacilli bacterium]
MTQERYIGLLCKPFLNNKEVCEILGISKSGAYEVMNVCRKKFNGAIVLRPSDILTESLMNYLGTTTKKELDRITISREVQEDSFKIA